MRDLQERSPIWHAVAWIGIYVVVVNIADWISDVFGEPNSATTALLAVLAVGLVLYLRSDGWLRYYGVRPVRRRNFSATLLYIPLVLVAVMQYTKGLRNDLDLTAVLVIVALMICVGFLEELIFRGMLFRSIQRTSNLTRAINRNWCWLRRIPRVRTSAPRLEPRDVGACTITTGSTRPVNSAPSSL